MSLREKLSGAVRWKDAAGGAVAFMAMCGGFAAWLISQAQAEVQGHIDSPNPHPAIEKKLEDMDRKMDRVLFYIIDEKHKLEPEVPASQPQGDPVPPWIKAGKKR